MKLHLGCGERYLEGYVNIDFPSEEHTVQKRSVADLKVDLLELTYPLDSIDEVRLHHVFEHFPRQVACGLLAAWHAWMKTGGCLRIEVPDLTRTALAAINPFASLRRRLVAERHLFGSHEAPWAVHREGYSVSLLRELIESFGFAVKTLMRNAWRGTYNIDVLAFKRSALTRADCDAAARKHLQRYLLDDGETENRLLEAWMAQYSRQADIGWPRDA